MATPIFRELHKRNWTPEEFVAALDAAGESMNADRKNPVGLLISFVQKHCPPRAYPAAFRAAKRLTPMRDIMPGDEGSGE